MNHGGLLESYPGHPALCLSRTRSWWPYLAAGLFYNRGDTRPVGYSDWSRKSIADSSINAAHKNKKEIESNATKMLLLL